LKLQSTEHSTNDDIRKFLSKGRIPIFKPSVGDRIRGALVEEPKLLPLTQFGSKEPKLDDDGNPMQQLLLVLEVGEGRQRVYIDKPLMRDALWREIEASGADGLEIGGIIEIVRIEDVRCQNGGTAHAFEITYEPPADSEAPQW
jgi:hypothetical protein